MDKKEKPSRAMMKEEIRGKPGVYKYVHKKLGVIYVGRSSTSVETRIRAHAYEDAFAPYLSDCEIYYCLLPNRSVAVAMELLLLDHYRPMLNTYSKDDWPYTGKLPELDWKIYECSPKELVAVRADNSPEAVGLRIANRRAEIGMTQKELGDLTGYTVGGISGIELGRRALNVQKLAIFATALNLEPGEIVII